MSENPERLVKTVTYTVERAQVIPSPVDPTLKVAGAAADAKVTGERIAAVLNKLQINGKTVADNVIVLFGTDIKMSSEEGAQTLKEAIENAADKSAADITYDEQTLETVKDVIDAIREDLDTDLSDEDVAEIMAAVFTEEEGA